jgi:hypothetical protein
MPCVCWQNFKAKLKEAWPKISRFLEVLFSYLAFCFLISAIFVPWASIRIRVPNQPEDSTIYPSVGRGLINVNIYDGYGTIVSQDYYRQDANGEDLDPFCGSSNQTSIFGEMFPILFPNGTSMLTSENPQFKADRSDDQFDWCSRKRATSKYLGCSVIIAIIANVFLFVTVVRGKGCRLIPTILNIAAAGTTITALSTFGHWLKAVSPGHHHHHDEDFSWHGDAGFGLSITSVVFTLLSVLLTITRCCCECGKRRCCKGAADLPPYTESEKTPLIDEKQGLINYA